MPKIGRVSWEQIILNVMRATKGGFTYGDIINMSYADILIYHEQLYKILDAEKREIEKLSGKKAK